MYARCSKDVVLTSLPADLEFLTDDPDSPDSSSLSTDPPLPTIEMDIFAYSDLDLLIAHLNGNDLLLSILFSEMFPITVLPYYFISLSYLFLLFLYLNLIRKQ